MEELFLCLSDCGLQNSQVTELAYVLQAPKLHTFYMWLTNNHLTDVGAQTLFHRVDAAAHLCNVYVDVCRNYLSVYGLLAAQEYRNRNPGAEVAYLPRSGRCGPPAPFGPQMVHVKLPSAALSSQQRLYSVCSRASRVPNDARWTHLFGQVPGTMIPRMEVQELQSLMRTDRHRWMRTTYPDIIVDLEAWDGPRPEWLSTKGNSTACG
jgi:hypothetical protein